MRMIMPSGPMFEKGLKSNSFCQQLHSAMMESLICYMKISASISMKLTFVMLFLMQFMKWNLYLLKMEQFISSM